MTFKKRFLLLPIGVIIILSVVYFIYAFSWSVRYNSDQRSMSDNIPTDYTYSSVLIRDPNGYFGVIACANSLQPDTFLIDTQASSLADPGYLEEAGASYKGRKPMPTFNFYGQIYFPKIYVINGLKIGDASLHNVYFNEVPRQNGMSDAMYRPIIGRNILYNFIWKFDIDNNILTMMSNRNPDMLKRQSEGYTSFSDGINSLPVTVGNCGTSEFIVDLGSDYEILIDRNIAGKLSETTTAKQIATMRREGLIDTVTQFSGVTVNIGDLTFRNCVAKHIPSIDRNIIGQRFMSRTNFILAYERDSDGYNSEDLYITPRRSEHMTVTDSLSSLGFDVSYRNGKLKVTMLELSGAAQRAGLKLGDKIESLNHGTIPTDFKSVSKGMTEHFIRSTDSIDIVVERDKNMTLLHIMR